MYLTLTRNAPRSLSLSKLLSGFFAAVAREIRIRRDLRMLDSFDDAALHDIGLTRGGVEDVVRHGRRWNRERPGYEPTHGRRTCVPALPAAQTEWR